MKTISKFALTALMAGAAFTATPHAASAAGDVQAKFTAADADKSGSLSINEYIDHATGKKDMTADEASQKFASLDVNKDDRLSLTELEAGWKDKKAKTETQVQ